jgi:hypothetical protein
LAIPVNVCHLLCLCKYANSQLKFERVIKNASQSKTFIKLSKEAEDSGQEREGMPKSPKARKESSKREREEGRMSEEGLNPFRKSSRTERSPSRGEERNQSKEIEKKRNSAQRDKRGYGGNSRGRQSTKKGISGSEREGGRARKRGHAEIVRRKETKQQERKRRG